MVVNRAVLEGNASAVRTLFSDLLGRRGPSTTPRRAAVEVELKLDVAAEHLNGLKRHPLLNKRSSRKEEVVSIYLDTKDRVFRRHGLSFRLRRKGGELLQAIKGPYRGILNRSERETLVIRNGSDSRRAVDAFLGDLDQNLPTALKPIFTTKVNREIYQIGGIELCLDKGEIIAGRRSSPIAEIELELASGDRRKLFALARQIAAIIPAEISVRSKSDRGYDFVDGIKARAVVAQVPVLPRFPTIAEAFQIICGECLHQLISNLAGVRARTPEAVHQARVALRRLDAAVRIFSDIQSEKAVKVADELKWIGDELAGARELDVFMTDFLGPFRSKQPKDLHLAKTCRACDQLREKSYERANAALSSQRFRRFLIDVAEWIETGSEEKARLRAKGEPSAKDTISRTLSKIWRKMRAARRIDELDLRRLHKLRLRAKRMRYTIEFTRGLYEVSPKRVEGMLKQLGKLQTALGKLNDMASARAIVKRIAVEAKPSAKSGQLKIASGLTTIAGDQERQTSKQLRKAAKAFEKLENLKPFWT